MRIMRCARLVRNRQGMPLAVLALAGLRGVDFEDRDGARLGCNSRCFVRNSWIACSTRSCTVMPLNALASLSCLCVASEIRALSGLLRSDINRRPLAPAADWPAGNR